MEITVKYSLVWIIRNQYELKERQLTSDASTNLITGIFTVITNEIKVAFT